jgi:hypothetical protein
MANTINVTSDTVVKIIIRRGTDLDRQNITLYSGELGYTVDTKRLFIGDGVTQGGILVGNTNFGVVNNRDQYSSLAYNGDLAFQNFDANGNADNKLYSFSKINGWTNIHPVYGSPFDYTTGQLIFNPLYLTLDTGTDPTTSSLNIKNNITSYTLNVSSISVNSGTILSDPVNLIDIVNLNALLSGVRTAETYTRNYVGNNYVPLSGVATVFGTLSSTTSVSVSTLPINNSDLTNKLYVDQSIYNSRAGTNAYISNRFLYLSGGTLTNVGDGQSTVTFIPTNNALPAVSIKQVGSGPSLVIQDTNRTIPQSFYVDNYGSVGIGVKPPTNPNVQLSVLGTISASGTTTIGGNATVGGTLGVTSNATVGGNLQIDQSNYAAIQLGNNINGRGFTITKESDNTFNVWTNVLGSGVNRFKIDQSGNTTLAVNGGNVGIGINTPTEKLHVYGGDALIQRTGGNDGAVFFSNQDTYVYGNTVGNYLTFGTNNVERMRIDASGRVGIGTTIPAVALDIVGKIHATDTISSDNDIIAFASSDERLKTNIKPIASALEKIDNINGVEYDWNTDLQPVYNGHDVGVIAQEIEQVLPEAVITRNDGYKAVNYDKIIPLLLQAIKELKVEVQSLKK